MRSTNVTRTVFSWMLALVGLIGPFGVEKWRRRQETSLHELMNFVTDTQWNSFDIVQYRRVSQRRRFVFHLMFWRWIIIINHSDWPKPFPMQGPFISTPSLNFWCCPYNSYCRARYASYTSDLSPLRLMSTVFRHYYIIPSQRVFRISFSLSPLPISIDIFLISDIADKY